MMAWRVLTMAAVVGAAIPATAEPWRAQMWLVQMWKSPPAQEPPPPKMTTHSAEYCAHLVAEFARAQRTGGSAPAEARGLAEDGMRLCDRGQYRAGVARLRRALHMVRAGY